MEKLIIKCRSSLPEVFLRKGILKICSKFTGENPCRSAILIKMLSNFIELAFWHGCSPVNLLQIFRTSFPKSTSGRLLLKILYLEIWKYGKNFTYFFGWINISNSRLRILWNSKWLVWVISCSMTLWLVWVILCNNFRKLWTYLESTPSNFSKSMFSCKNRNSLYLGLKCFIWACFGCSS